MLSKVFVILACLLAVGIVSFFVLGNMSKSGVAPGLKDGKLTRCSPKPNGVCSEFSDDSEHYIEPLAITDNDVVKVLANLKDVIKEASGVVVVEQENYLATIFTSKFFGFVDDVEFRVDVPNKLIHVRSASRVGHSDLAVNPKRVESIRALLLKK